jgi:curved DNA-binding protein
MDFKDYYKILGVDKKASAEEIKRAYKKLAKEYHPDTNKNSNAESKFKDLSEAYTVLGDSDKRKKYDNLGSSWQSHRQTGGTGDDFNWQDWINQNQRTKSTGRRTGQTVGDAFEGGGISDFFERVFGGGFGGRSASPKQQAAPPIKGEDFQTDVELTLEEAFSGASRILTLNNEKFEIKFKPGIKDEQILKISGKGYPGKNSGLNGDLIIKIKVSENPKYERLGDDLNMEAHIDLYTAILGGESKIATLGGNLKINITPETQNGKILKLKGQGMPLYTDNNQRGELFIKLLVKLPSKLTDREKVLFSELKEIHKSKKK